MTQQDRLKLKILELIKKINLPELNDVIESLVTEIYTHERECRIADSEYKDRSYYTEVHDKPHCLIRLKKVSESNGIDFLWDLFHEFGHHQDIPIDKDEDDYQSLAFKQKRELKAWYLSNKNFDKYEILKKFSSDYVTYRLKSIQTYKISYQDYFISMQSQEISEYLHSDYENKFDSMIELMVNKINKHERGCQVEINKSLSYSKFRSNTNRHYFDLGVNYEDKRIIVWDLFHEHGHQIDEPLKDSDLKEFPDGRKVRTEEAEKRRELFAWNEANKEFLKHSELHNKADIKSYTNYIKKCFINYNLSIDELKNAYPDNYIEPPLED